MMKNSTKNTNRWHVRSKRTGSTVKTAGTRDSARAWRRGKAKPSAYYMFDTVAGRTIR